MEFHNIDINRLDEEWIQQPKNVYNMYLQLAESKEILNTARAKAEVTTAELDFKIRSNPQKFGIEKVTEAGINNVIKMQVPYLKAQKRIIQAQKNHDIVIAAVNALDHKKSALERLVALHGQAYFAKPQASDENSKEIVDEFKRKAIKNKMNRKSS
jgi:hypothetical protein